MNETALMLPQLHPPGLDSAGDAPPGALSEVTSARARTEGATPDAATRFRNVVDAEFAFIWRALRGLGIPAHSVDDAAQHVFWIAAQKLDSIAVGSERAFLFSTALGVSANARRALQRSREVPDEDALGAQLDGAPDAETLLAMKEERALLDRVLGEMPDDLRTVFVLFVLEGTPTPEIAELLGVPSGTVASRLRRAREAFHGIARRIQALQASSGKRGAP
ncbi:MAG TPA: RNA polymerase sigma factor [Polyangiaceae bacterium]